MKLFKLRVGISVFCGVFLLSLAPALLFSTPVLAASGEWVDGAHITIGDDTYIDDELFDDMDYFLDGVDNCTNVIKDFNTDYGRDNTDYGNATLITKSRDPRTGDCAESEESITLSKAENALILFHWVDSSTIESAYIQGGGILGTTSGIYEQLDGTNEFLHANDQTCRSGIVVNGQSGGSFTSRIAFGGCSTGDPINVRIGSTNNASKPAGTGSSQYSNDSGLTGENAPSCESEGGALAWIFCPLLTFIDDQIDKLDGAINRLLQQPPANFDDDSPLNGAWQVTRNFAYILLVPAMLIMVIGTALGFDFISAYTVKRALPRMIAAILFIALSWEICTLLIVIANDVGSGVLGLITAPFDTIPTSFSDIMGGGGGATLFTGIIAAGGLAGFILGPALVGILLSYGFVALVGILVGIFVLTIRQILILFLVLIAPLAILVWIFPNNDKPWKLWWSSFSKLLLMYPLIMAILAIGRVFAGVTSTGDSFDGFLEFTVKLIAYIAPYFFIPATFKFAGGMFATLSGMANDKGRGLFDRQRKFRQGLASERHVQNMDGTSSLGKGRFGSSYRRLASAGRNGSWTPTGSGRARWQQQEMKVAEQAADKLLEAGGARAFNDDDASSILRQYGISGSDFTAQYEKMGHTKQEAQAALHRAELATGAKVGSRGMAVAAQKFRVGMTNTAYDPGVAGLEQMQKELGELQGHGLATAYDVAGWMKANRGRADYSANGFVGTVDFVSGRATAAQQLAGAFEGADPRDIVGGHQRAVESFAQQAATNLEQAVASQDPGNIDRALADAANIHSTLSNISAKKGDSFVKTVLSQGSKIQGVRPDPLSGKNEPRELTFRELIDDARNNSGLHKDFHDRVREYSSGRDANSAAQAAEAIIPPDQT